MLLGYIFLFFLKIYYFFTSLTNKIKLPEVPYIKINDEIINKGYEEVFKILKKNLGAPAGKINDFWAKPSSIFAGCYLWDSAFISQIWKYWDVKTAGRILKPLFNRQAEDGRIPHHVNPIQISKISQPPLLAWAVSNLDLSPEYLLEVYPLLKKYNEWLCENRQLDSGLFFWQHFYENGIDNGPRFTDQSDKIKDDLTNIAPVDLNSYLVLQYDALIKIAKKLKPFFDKQELNADIQIFEEKKSRLIEIIQKYLWDEEYGLYFDFDFNKNQRVEINTIVSFFPLIAEIPNEHQTSLMVNHLGNSHEYNTKIPFPTIARNDNHFEKDTWRGPVWVNAAYLVIKGLEKKQLFQLSSELTYNLVKGVYNTWKNEGFLYEFYDPDRYDLKELTRKKGNLYKRLSLGKKPVKNFVGWTGLVNSLLIESIVGFSINEKHIQPLLPVELKGKSIILGFPSQNFELEVSYSSEKLITIRVSDLQGKKEDLIKECNLYQKISLEEFFT